MSQLKLKQINPYGAADGSIILFDGTKPVWSNQQSRGLVIPGGTTAQRTNATNGLLRFNSDNQKLEVYQNSQWQNVLAGPQAFKTLSDVPATYTGASGKVVRVKTDESGLEYTAFPSALKRYRIRINFTSTSPSSWVGVGDTTAWTVNGVASGGTISGTTLTIAHNVTNQPSFITSLGYRSTPAPAKYRLQIPINGTFTFQYEETASNQFSLIGCDSTNTGSVSGTHCYIDIYFMIS